MRVCENEYGYGNYRGDGEGNGGQRPSTRLVANTHVWGTQATGGRAYMYNIDDRKRVRKDMRASEDKIGMDNATPAG